MRQTLIAALFVLALAALVFTPAHAQTVLPPATKTTIEAAINNRLAQIQTFQTAYQGSNGRYMQVIWSHIDTPSNITLATNLTAKPYYQHENTDYFFQSVGLSTTLPMRLKVDQYDGPNGKGYVLTVEVKAGMTLYQRAWNFGAENYREINWATVMIP